MLGRWGRDAGSLLGVEIASGVIRMLWLRRRGGRRYIAGWACQPISPATKGASLFDDPEPLVAALSQAHRRCAAGHRQVALALPASQVICKVCQVSSDASEATIEAHLLAQAEQLFPFPLDDLALDFQLAGPSPGAPGKTDVLVAACRQRQLDPFEQVFAQAGLDVVAMEVDSFALRRVLQPELGAGALMLQLEPDATVLHRWPFGLQALREQLPRGGAGCWVDDVMRVLNADVAGVDSVVLAGSGADQDNAQRLAQRLGKPCTLVELPPVSGCDAVPGAAMTLACGLALGAWR